MESSDSVDLLILNHPNCPILAATGARRLPLKTVARIEIAALSVNPLYHSGVGSSLYRASIATIAARLAKASPRFSSSHSHPLKLRMGGVWSFLAGTIGSGVPLPFDVRSCRRN
jgi:hypothetical protein